MTFSFSKRRMSSSDAALIASLNNVSNGISRYLSIFIYLFGIIGNVLNVLLLSQKTLRTNPCSLYFLASSVANIIAIVSGLTTKMLTGWVPDVSNTIDWLCQFRIFILFASKNVAAWLILLASIDRWFVSHINANRRKQSTIKNTRYGIILTIVFSIVIYSPVFYCYQANLINAPIKCYGKTEVCRLLNDLIYAILTIIVPIVFMLIYGVMTLINIQQVKIRIHIANASKSTNTVNSVASAVLTQASKKKLDRRLFVMLIVQVILLTLFTLPQAIRKLYSSLTTQQTQTLLNLTINNFIFNLLLLLTYIANGMPFYIYTLSGGTVFRNALKGLFRKTFSIGCH